LIICNLAIELEFEPVAITDLGNSAQLR